MVLCSTQGDNRTQLSVSKPELLHLQEVGSSSATFQFYDSSAFDRCPKMKVLATALNMISVDVAMVTMDNMQG